MNPATHSDAGARLDAILPVAAPQEWVSVAGIPMPARVVDTLLRGGAQRVVVVCPRGSGTDAQRALSGAAMGAEVVVVESREDGVDPSLALLNATEHVAAPVLLAMPDCLFSPDIVRGILMGATSTSHTLIAVDSNIARCPDIAGALKIRQDGPKVTEVGAALEVYDGLAPGVLLACEDLFAELSAVRTALGWASLASALEVLATSGELFGFDCGVHRWSATSSVASRAHAERLLQLYGDDLLEQRPSSVPPLVQRDRFRPSPFESAARRQRSGRLRPLYDAD